MDLHFANRFLLFLVADYPYLVFPLCGKVSQKKYARNKRNKIDIGHRF